MNRFDKVIRQLDLDDCPSIVVRENYDTLIDALKLASKILREPSDDLCIDFAEQWFSQVRCVDDCQFENCWPVIRNRLLIEVNNND